MTKDALFYGKLICWGDIEKMISDEVRESQLLEYKRAENKFSNREKDEIAKDVSAMANAGGGVIIYGVGTDSSDKTKPVEISGINEDNIETFDRVVNSRIRSVIGGIEKKIIQNGATAGKKVMIVYVPQSDESPHQSLVDNKYYQRMNSENLPMPHDLVELHFGKRRSPKLSLRVEKVDFSKIELLSSGNESRDIPLKISLTNNGRRMARYIQGYLYFSSDNVSIVTLGTLTPVIGQSANAYQCFQYIDNSGVIHPEVESNIVTLNIKVNAAWARRNCDTNPLMKWVLNADGMTKQEGDLFLWDLFENWF